MTTPTVIWMRHGTCHDGLTRPDTHPRPTSPLHPRGAREVSLTASTLNRRGWRVTTIVTSPLPRAATSATIAAVILDIPHIHHDETLREWAAPDMVIGLNPRRYPPEYQAWRANRHQRIGDALPGGESLAAIADRAATARTRLTNLATQAGPILAISHRVLIGCVVALEDGITEPAEIFNRARELPLPPAGLWSPTHNDS